METFYATVEMRNTGYKMAGWSLFEGPYGKNSGSLWGEEEGGVQERWDGGGLTGAPFFYRYIPVAFLYIGT